MKTRRSCQKCRYDLCLGAGMKSDAVMRDDEKQQRFKKSIIKKQRVAQVAERKSAAAAVGAAAAMTGSARRASAGDGGGGGGGRGRAGGESRLAPEQPSPPAAPPMPGLLPAGGMGGFPVQRSPPFAEFNPYNLEIKQEEDAISLGSGSGTSEEYREEIMLRSQQQQHQQHQFYLKQQQQLQRFTASYPHYAEMSSRLLPSPPSTTMTSSGHPPPPPPTLVPPPPFQRPFLRPQISHLAEQVHAAAAANNFRSQSNGHSEEDLDLDGMAEDDYDDVKPLAAVERQLVKPSVSEALIAERGEWRNFPLFLRAQAAWKAAMEETEADANFGASMVNLHRGFRTLTKAQLRGHIAHFDAVFNSFASKIDEFCSLDAKDQGWIHQSSLSDSKSILAQTSSHLIRFEKVNLGGTRHLTHLPKSVSNPSKPQIHLDYLTIDIEPSTEHLAETQRAPLCPVCARAVLLRRFRARAAIVDAAQLSRVQYGSDRDHRFQALLLRRLQRLGRAHGLSERPFRALRQDEPEGRR